MNTLEVHELRTLLKSPKTRPQCTHCEQHPATDVHHINGIHHDNAPANLDPYCKRCHNEVHDISDNLTDLTLAARQFDAIQRERIAMNNRLSAYHKLGYDAEVAQTIYDHLVDLEKFCQKVIEKSVKREPIYTEYLSHIKGVGPNIAAALISEIGDPGRFETVSALWAYCGLSVIDGQSQKRRKGQKANWNQKLRMIAVGRLVPQFIKLKGKDAFGRHLYDQYKAFYTARDGETLSKGHVDNRARRKVAKVFLSCLWDYWRRMKGLSVTKPYAMARLNHTHLVTADEWMQK